MREDSISRLKATSRNEDKKEEKINADQLKHFLKQSNPYLKIKKVGEIWFIGQVTACFQ